jgi:14-3-3 protein epsilon
MSGTREELVFMATMAEQAERYDHVIEFMKRIALMGTEMTVQERTLLSTAYKQSVGQCRSALRQVKVVASDPQIATDPQAPQIMAAMRDYQSRLEAALNAKCQDILDILDKSIPLASTADNQVFLMKMKGDYHRYLAEFTTADAFVMHSNNASSAYEGAMASAEGSLPPQNHIRLGLALNLSVFLYEVMGARDPAFKTKATEVAKRALDDGLRVIQIDPNNKDTLDAQEILSLLKDNMIMWSSSQSGSPDDGTAVDDL